MAFVPIAESGLSFTFTPTGGTTMPASVVSAVDEATPAFEIAFVSEPGQPPLVRVTVQAYEAGNPSGPVENATFVLSSENPQVIVPNEEAAANPQTAFTPAEFQGDCRALSYSGSVGAEWSGIESFEFLIEVDVEAPVVVPCEEIGRVTRAFVSAHQRDRVHSSNLIRGEKRCLVADFNGSIPPARTIASATWRTNENYVVAMANPRIFENDRSTAIDITAIYGYCGAVKCVAVLDNGEIYVQLFVVSVRDMPWFPDENLPAAGPTVLMVSAP